MCVLLFLAQCILISKNIIWTELFFPTEWKTVQAGKNGTEVTEHLRNERSNEIRRKNNAHKWAFHFTNLSSSCVQSQNLCIKSSIYYLLISYDLKWSKY